MKIILVLVAFLGSATPGRASQKPWCKVHDFEQTLPYWMKRFGIKVQPNVAVTAAVLHKATGSPLDISHKLTPFEQQFNLTSSHRYMGFFSLQHTGDLLPFKQPNFEILFHFYHGDPVILHTIGGTTGELKSLELGPNAGRFVGVVKQGYWYAYEFRNPATTEEYALLGVTTIRKESTFDLVQPGADLLVQKFPNHANLINRLQLAYKP